jgi:AcrR family transcriptional regulator
MSLDPPTTVDRRVRRTRALLHDALIELILDRGYDQITVQDILDRADVGRSTFYKHYDSKDQLLLSGLDDLRAAVSAINLSAPRRPGPGPRSTSPFAVLWPLFEHAADNHQLCRALLGGQAGQLTRRAGQEMLGAIITTQLRDYLGGRSTADEPDDPQAAELDNVQLEITVAVLVDGLMGLLSWWLETRPELPARVVYSHFEQVATHGIEPASIRRPR